METSTKKRQPLSRGDWAILVGMVGVLLAYIFTGYLIFYWGFYRGGSFLWNEVIVPLFALLGPSNKSDALKILWGTLGVFAIVFLAAQVRFVYVLRALQAKVVTLGVARDNILKMLDEAKDANYADLSLECRSIKYLFAESDYSRLAKCLEPNLALMVLRTVSAIELITTATSASDVNTEIARIGTQVRNQLEALDLPALTAKFRLQTARPQL